MRYDSRSQVELIGSSGSSYETDQYGHKARVLSSFWMYLDPDDLGFTPHMTTKREGYWESWITLWMSQNVAPDSRCIDIGANMGYYTLFLLAHGCKVRAVEPQAHLADLIEMSVKENGFKLYTDTVDRVAVSDETGMAVLITPHGHGMNASIVRDQPGVTVATEVETVKLDDFCEGGQHYDFIKIDAEGAEDAIFRGAWEFIEENPECVWLVEWRWDDREVREQTARRIFELMHVSWVNFEGVEIPLSYPEELSSRKDADWMLVLRRKK